MSATADICDTLRDLLEPATSDVKVNDTLARPYDWAPNTLYVFPSGQYTPNLVGTSREVDREEFQVSAVYSLGRGDEESQHRMSRAVSVELIDKAHDYIAIVRANRNGSLAGQPMPWDHLTAVVDWDFLTEFNVRGIALICTGYRMRH